MDKSIWLQRYENEMKELQKRKKPKKLCLMFVPILLLGFFGVIMMRSQKEIDVVPYVIVMTVLYFFLVLAALLSQKIITKDVAKGERENLAQLLATTEQIQEFDAEMTSAPKCEFDTQAQQHVFFTEHYIAVKYQNTSCPHYRFARLSEIALNDVVMNGMGKLCMIELKKANGKKLMRVSFAGKKKMEEFEQLLIKYCPEIHVNGQRRF